MIKILSIGNSFSEDAHIYLSSIAENAGMEVEAINLFIPACSLERHYNNMKNDAAEYEYEINGIRNGKIVSIRQVLEEESFDYITLQQASAYSGMKETYYPYISELAKYVRKKSSDSKIILLQTWAYEKDSEHEGFFNYENSQQKMFKAITQAYDEAAKNIGAEIIPCGTAIQALRDNCAEFDIDKGGISLCRDGFHLSYLYGRYAAGCVLFEKLLSGNILENSFMPETENEETDVKLIELIKNIVHSIKI